ncbi:MAG: hypothetical protein GY930_13970 [bacterium]|nr:hypothetical protein [bacterium]
MRWSPVDDRHHRRDGRNYSISGRTQSPVSRAAICGDPDGTGFFFFFGCDSDWNSITDTWHLTLNEAIQQAEFENDAISDSSIDDQLDDEKGWAMTDDNSSRSGGEASCMVVTKAIACVLRRAPGGRALLVF